MKILKAFLCRFADEEECTIVFAWDHNSARKLACRSEAILNVASDFRGNVYYQVRAKRLRHLDYFADGDLPYEPHFFNDETIPLFRAAGMHEMDSPTCGSCGLSSYGKAEYALCENCANCKECGCDESCKSLVSELTLT